MMISPSSYTYLPSQSSSSDTPPSTTAAVKGVERMAPLGLSSLRYQISKNAAFWVAFRMDSPELMVEVFEDLLWSSVGWGDVEKIGTYMLGHLQLQRVSLGTSNIPGRGHADRVLLVAGSHGQQYPHGLEPQARHLERALVVGLVIVVPVPSEDHFFGWASVPDDGLQEYRVDEALRAECLAAPDILELPLGVAQFSGVRERKIGIHGERV
ncbi:hypothetical protein PG996_004232 [Apiospora saccharicola]|uniref:Uncharacterized protein n=1 Tax=Apiospora saccharicola TaxID=335842 RepID=A0ABR1W3K4_9PEZI